MYLPCLLERWDRWLEHQGPQSQLSDWDDVRADVVRNLGWLLNAEAPRWLNPLAKVKVSLPAEVAASVLAFGVPPLVGVSRSLAARQQATKMAAEIAICIARFEPRIENLEVEPVESQETGDYGLLHFHVRGTLRAIPVMIFEVNTEFDLVTGQAIVRV